MRGKKPCHCSCGTVYRCLVGRTVLYFVQKRIGVAVPQMGSKRKLLISILEIFHLLLALRKHALAEFDAGVPCRRDLGHEDHLVVRLFGYDPGP